MLKKYGKFYADWLEDGKRKRKAFRTRAEAIAHQEKMRGKAKRRRPRSPGSAKHSRGQEQASTTSCQE